jgi:beta-glucosidase/6-phospho-beta-glucosidase/beta-galactosidase
MVLTTQAIRAANPQSVLVQVEALWKFTTQSAQHAEKVALQNEHQYLVFDLTTGRINSQHPLYGYLREFGASESQLDWFQHNKATYDVFGANFYPWSYGEYVPRADGTLRRVRRKTSGWAIAEVVEDSYRRYNLPVMVTETSATEKMAGRAQWMDETIAAVFDLRKKGVPVVGYTWFPLITMIDWAYRRGRKPVSEYLLNLGLIESSFDADGVLKRKPTEHVARYHGYTSHSVPDVGLPDEQK